MTRLIFVRHGESMGNFTKTFIGHTDIDLTERGYMQAEKTAEYLDAYKIDKIYSSDLKRAYHTAEAVAKRRGLDIVTTPSLREINGGVWEGVLFDDLEKSYPAYKLWLSSIGKAVCDGGESIVELQNRVNSAVLEIVAENPGKTVLIATHATPISTMRFLWAGENLAESKKIQWVSNASVTIVDYTDGKPSLEVYGYDNHLTDMKTALPDNV